MANEKSPAVRTSFDTVRSRLDAEAGITTTEDTSLRSWIEGKLSDIMSAPSFEDINKLAEESGTSASKNLVGRTFEIRDFALRESFDAYRENSALQKYALVQATDVSTGEEIIMDGGGDTFVAQLVSMRDLYGFPYTGTLLGLKTGSGFELLYWRWMDPKRKPINPRG